MPEAVTRVAVVPTADGGGLLQALTDDGAPASEPARVTDLAGAVQQREASGPAVRWVWRSAVSDYPPLLAAGARVETCHDVTLVATILDGYDGHWHPPQFPLLADPDRPPTLFEVAKAAEGSLEELVAEHADQRARLAAAASATGSAALDLLAAADSASALVAVEMGHVGLPWRVDVHDELLTRLLGSRPAHAGRPERVQALADRVAAALDSPGLNPDSPTEVIKAFIRQGITVTTTRAWELRRVEHPAVPLLLEYKELARLHAAHGWAWREAWVRGGRFRPEYVPAGVVSGRWASRGGGALQIPKAVRSAVVADRGWQLVVADARQLEPRVLAAMSGDPGMARAAVVDDLYDELATASFAGDRNAAKVGLISAMYGGGSTSPALAVLRRRYPRALELLERAARTGEDGGLVRSVLGRTCPPPRAGWQEGAEEEVRRRARDRGRFTRNFVIQASAADWAAVLLALLRQRLQRLGGAPRPELVFFQHDEVMVHTPEAVAEAVADAVHASAAQATRLVLGETAVRVPMAASIVTSYAEAK